VSLESLRVFLQNNALHHSKLYRNPSIGFWDKVVTKLQTQRETDLITRITSVSVLVILEQKCTLAALRAAPWWVILSMRHALY